MQMSEVAGALQILRRNAHHRVNLEHTDINTPISASLCYWTGWQRGQLIDDPTEVTDPLEWGDGGGVQMHYAQELKGTETVWWSLYFSVSILASRLQWLILSIL